MATTESINRRRALAAERAEAAQSRLVERFGMERAAPPPATRDADLRTMLQLESAADFLEGVEKFLQENPPVSQAAAELESPPVTESAGDHFGDDNAPETSATVAEATPDAPAYPIVDRVEITPEVRRKSAEDTAALMAAHEEPPPKRARR